MTSQIPIVPYLYSRRPRPSLANFPSRQPQPAPRALLSPSPSQSAASNRMGVRLEGAGAGGIGWALASGGEGGSHPSNILDNGYAFGTVNVNGASARTTSSVLAAFKRGVGMDSAVVSRPSSTEAWKKLGITAVRTDHVYSAVLCYSLYS